MCIAVAAVGMAATVAGVAAPEVAVATWIAALMGGALLCFSLCQAAFASAMVGIALGVAGHIFVAGVGSGVEWVLTARLGALNGHVLVTKYGLDFTEYEEISEALEDHPDVNATSPFAYGTVTISPALSAVEEMEGDDAGAAGGRGPAVMMLKGVLPARAGAFPGFSGVFVTGTADDPMRAANPNAPPGLVVGHALAMSMGLTIGDEVIVAAPRPLDGTGTARRQPPRHARFVVTGFASTGMREIDARVGLCHLTAAQALLFGEARVTGVEASLRDPQVAPEVANGVVTRVQPAGRRLYRATTWMDQGSELLQLVRRTQLGVHAALALLLLVAGANLVGALIILMRRRAGEIATLGVLGASPTMQGRLFTAVGLAIGMVGGALGVLLAGAAGGVLAHTRIGLDPAVYGVEALHMRPSTLDVLV
ncbi:MAG: ABC transporter permease, partial [Nannocystaceae bacterium]